MQNVFKIDVADRDARQHLTVQGELDLATAPLLDEQISLAERTDAPLIVVDLATVSFMDSTGLTVLLRANDRSRHNGNRLRITEGPAQVQRLFEVAGVCSRLPLISPDDRHPARQGPSDGG
ncbi:MAG: STAS domain-containing protein [Solirubrobacteraceae bacterium]